MDLNSKLREKNRAEGLEDREKGRSIDKYLWHKFKVEKSTFQMQRLDRTRIFFSNICVMCQQLIDL